MNRWSLAVFMLFAVGARGAAQTPAARPTPDPIVPDRGYRQALARGTRSPSGAPGQRYWQQWTDYRIHASIDPDSKMVEGGVVIVYHNNSPDTLPTLWLQMIQNVHVGENPRNEPAEVTGGYQLRRVAARGQTLEAVRSPRATGAGYLVNGTRMAIHPAVPLLPGDSIRLELDYGYKLAQAGASERTGYSRDNLLFLAYWYPQMAVYDDVVGWQTDPFLGTAEFYMGNGRYEYTVDVPEGWVVSGTGELTNAAAVLAPNVLARWRRAAQSDTTVKVLSPAEYGPGRSTVDSPSGRLQWSFRADSVRDVTFSVMRNFNWDAARTPIGDRDGDRRTDYVLIQSFWRDSAPRWRHSVRYGQQSITHHSAFTGVKYPWPHMTAVEGEDIIGGGMEYPMMTLIGPYTQTADSTLYAVTAHEIGHMWFPMIVGVDERRYGWMDEGTTDFNENNAFDDFYPGPARRAEQREQQQYVSYVENVGDAEMLRWTDFQQGGAGGFSTYTKPATVLHALRGLLGEDTFLRAYRKYASDWAFRQPKPWDFFNEFNTVSGQNLDWFWDTWYREEWTLDQAIAGVSATDAGTVVTVEDRGTAPMPARILATRLDGTTSRAEIPVGTWLAGARGGSVTIPAGSPVVRVEIDAEHSFPDVDRNNNVWTRP